MRNLESRLQQMAVKWFRLQHPNRLIFAIPNGGHRNKITASILKSEGVMAGIPDLFIPESSGGYHGLFIEMKQERGKLSQSQKEMVLLLRARNYYVDVAYSFEEFCEMVNNYFDLL